MTYTGDWEIFSISGGLLDNLGELAYTSKREGLGS